MDVNVDETFRAAMIALIEKRDELQAEVAACKRERDALCQGIKPVVIWLRNGCDPVEASKELLLLLENGK